MPSITHRGTHPRIMRRVTRLPYGRELRFRCVRKVWMRERARGGEIGRFGATDSNTIILVRIFEPVCLLYMFAVWFVVCSLTWYS